MLSCAAITIGHREFSSCRQQDSSEYFQHLLQVLEREEFKQQHTSTVNSLFSFDLEERYQCDVTGEVKYVMGQQTRQNVLELRIPLEAYTGDESIRDTVAAGTTEEKKEDEGKEEAVKRQKLHDHSAEDSTDKAASERATVPPSLPTIPLEACLDAYFQSGQVDLRNPSLGWNICMCIVFATTTPCTACYQRCKRYGKCVTATGVVCGIPILCCAVLCCAVLCCAVVLGSELSTATKTVSFASFPKYLMVKLGR